MASGSGRCLCGAVQYKFDPDAVIWQGHCHCESCRRACAAPIVSWLGVRKSAWRWFGAKPKQFQSSTWATRYFCESCGSQIAYVSTKLPDEIHGLAATLDDPGSYAPQAHFFHSKALPWLHIKDRLPRYLDGGKTPDKEYSGN